MFILIEYLLTQLAMSGTRSLRATVLAKTNHFEPILITRHATTILVLSFMYHIYTSMSVL